MKGFLKKLGLFALVFILLNMLLGALLTRVYQWYPETKHDWIFSKKDMHYDYAFLGSSRTLFMADINTIDQHTGLQGINLGVDGSGMADNFLTLYLFLRKNQVDAVFFQVDPLSLSSDSSFSDPFKEQSFIPYLNDCEVYTTSKALVKTRWFWRVFPWSRFVEFNSVYEIPNLLLRMAIHHRNFETQKGYIPLTGIMHAEPDYPVKVKQCTRQDQEFLEKIGLLCHQYRVPLIVYTAPFFNYEKYFRCPEFSPYIQSIAAKYAASYYDFSGAGRYNQLSFFEDYTHMNQEGTAAFSGTELAGLVQEYCVGSSPARPAGVPGRAEALGQ